MRADDSQRLCQEARLSYYDLLGADEVAVPESVRRHVATCPACQEQLRRLRDALSESEKSSNPPGSRKDETIEALTQQFQLLKDCVTCSRAKPFLPKLVLASPQLRIPTPVTVHVEYCPRCVEDLAALRQMNLTRDQLDRLGRLFELGRGEGVPPLPFCGGSAPPAEETQMACQEVSTADLFDLVVPPGAAPAEADPPSERQSVIAAHVRACPVCQGGAQILQRTLAGMIQRDDSETATIYCLENDAENAQGQAGDPFQYPVSVQVLQGGSGSAADPSDAPTVQRVGPRKLGSFSAGRLARVAAIAVASIALALLLRTTVLTASGTLAGDVLKAFAKAENVRVVVTNPMAGVVEEFWLARRSGRLVHKTARECVLFDLAHNRKRLIEPPAGTSVTARLDAAEHNRVRAIVATGLVEALERLSPDTKLDQPTDDTSAGTGENLDVYEIPPLSATSPLSRRYLAYIDPATRLPQRTELYQQRPRQSQWYLVTTTVFTYPTDQETNEAIQALFPAQ